MSPIPPERFTLGNLSEALDRAEERPKKAEYELQRAKRARLCAKSLFEYLNKCREKKTREAQES